MSLEALLAALQAPMVGASFDAMALAVSQAGGLGSLAAATLAPDEIGPAVDALRRQTDAPFAVNLLMAPPAARRARARGGGGGARPARALVRGTGCAAPGGSEPVFP
jgi:nitronate monooxygenase